MRFFHDTKINFMGKRTFFFWISLSLNLIGIIATLFMGIEYGIDFKGGSEIAYQFSKPIHTDQIRMAIEKAGIRGAEIKSYGKENQFLVRIKEGEAAEKSINAAFTKYFPDEKVTIIKSDKIGPKIGGELKNQAFFAILLSIIAILIYITFRFEFTFGFGAIIALIHDVILTFTFIVILNKTGLVDLEVNQSILAAMLTVVGFSLNDTVIIFDRIRENRGRIKGISFVKLCNVSINETLSRTINTVLTVVLVLLTLVVLGGPVLQGFAVTMLIGIITGTYSSIYIASSFVIFYLEKVKKVSLDDGDGAMKKESLKPAKA